MKYARAQSIHASLLQEAAIDIEADISQGLFSFCIVGLAGKAVEEARDRLYGAIRHSGFPSPKTKNRKIVVSLGPGHIRKTDTHFDLGIAIAYLLASEEISDSQGSIAVSETAFIGELTLDGSLRKCAAIVPLLLSCRRLGVRSAVIPSASANEASCADFGLSVYAAATLREAADAIQGRCPLPLLKQRAGDRQHTDQNDDAKAFAGVSGQEEAKRGLIISLAGCHHALAWGPPGTGKTSLIEGAASLQPALDEDAGLELMRLRSFAGLMESDQAAMLQAPYRSAHQSVSRAGLIGGGTPLRPGEMSLAHNGILALHEFMEMKTEAVEAMREPLESGRIRISTGYSKADLPAGCIVMAACNPCPCGKFGSTERCACPPGVIRRYAGRVSAAIWDRFDLHIRVGKSIGAKADSGLSSRQARETIARIRSMQKDRNRREYGHSGSNASVSGAALEETLRGSETLLLIRNFCAGRSISMRGMHKLLRISRTIADLGMAENIGTAHAAEAIRYRSALPFGGN